MVFLLKENKADTCKCERVVNEIDKRIFSRKKSYEEMAAVVASAFL